jgi:hypothetical protein
METKGIKPGQPQKPYQGLRRIRILGYPTTLQAKNHLKPYQGLKRYKPKPEPDRVFAVGKTLKPYQGLKHHA